MSNVDVFENLRPWAPKELLGLFDQIVFFFPDDVKATLRRVVDALPAGGNSLLRVFEVIKQQWLNIQPKHSLRVALTGPAQTGKKSLAKIIERRQRFPGRQVFHIVDSQGLEELLGYGRLPGSEEFAKTDLVLFLLDARLELTGQTVQMYEKVERLGKPVLVVLNKIDEAERPAEVIRNAKKLTGGTVVPMSIREPERIEDLFRAIVAAYPRALYPLAWSYPDYRKPLCKGIVTQATFAGIVAGAITVPVSPFFPLAAVHAPMVVKIGYAFGFNLDKRRATELLSVLAIDLLLTYGGQKLGERMSGGRALISASLAGISTLALGLLAIRYFESLSGALEDDAQAAEPDDDVVWG